MKLLGRLPAIILVLIAPVMTTPVLGQGGPGSNPYNSYDGSTLLQNNAQQNIYYPYWHNYLDNLQQEGGYQAVHGDYPNSTPVTSYYPSAADSQATTPQAAQSQMYSNYNEYYQSTGQPYANQAANQYSNPQYGQYQGAQPAQYQNNYQQQQLQQQQLQQQQLQQQQLQQQQLQQQAQAANPAQPGARQGPVEDPMPTPQQIAMEQEAFLRLSGRAAQQGAMAASMNQPQDPNAYGAQYGASGATAANAPAAGYNAGQQAYMNQDPAAAGTPGADQVTFSSDPAVRRAQQEALERAEARRRAAEQAAQQQAAMQELQQAQQLFEQAQSRLQEEEQKQKALQQEFHRRAVSDAYESLRQAQQRYYDLMGVEGEAGPPASNYQPPAAGAQNPMAVTTNPSYGAQPGAAPPAGPQSARQPAAAAQPQAQPQGQPQVTPRQPSQATPLYAQQPNARASQQGGDGSGLWGTLKSFFSGPGGRSQRGMFDRRGGGTDMAF
jgi:hypothetical protein